MTNEDATVKMGEPGRLTLKWPGIAENRVADLTKSREQWKLKAEQADSQLAALEAEILSLHAFDPFTQADTSLARGRGGLGLGLTLVRAIVELHGGSVEARSEGLGRGSEIVVRLPAVETDGAVVAGSPSLDDRPTPGANRAPERRRILMVEDNQDYALGLRRLLESAGHEVHICCDGLTALSEAPALGPDVILLDLCLPGMDGYEVARQMRTDDALARANIAVISGYASEEDRRRSREIGIDEHLAKPVLLSELLRVVTQTGQKPRQ